MTTADILNECVRRRIQLIPEGKLLKVDAAGKLGTALEKLLKNHKPALLRLLGAKRRIATKVLKGEFDDCDDEVWRELYGQLDT